MKTIKFFTLLYIDTDNRSLSHNGVSGNFDKQMETFIKCCEALNKSLSFFTGYELNVLTNNKAYIEKVSKNLKCIEIDFNFEVPRDIKFFAAHHKIDAFKYFSRLENTDYCFLIDSDVLCINKMPLNLLNCVGNNIPVYYDITDQVYPLYSREVIIKDKEAVSPGSSSVGLWAGGEFIGGNNEFFKSLSDEIDLIKENYLSSYKNLHHQGDEVLASVALEKMMKTKYICNVGLFGGIRRYWSGEIYHYQKKLTYYTDSFLLHLPADKKFIASLLSVDESIIKKYTNYLNKIFPAILLKRIIKRILKRKKYR